MAVSLLLHFGLLSAGGSHLDQSQDTRDTERWIGPDIDSGDFGPLCFREPTTLEMENSTRRHCTLLDEYDYAVVIQCR